jgi:putative isomerase
MFDHQAPDGTLPIMMDAQCPDRFCCTSGDPATNQAKPVMAQFALRLAEETGSVEWFRPCFDGLRKFHSRWDSKYLSPIGLLVWGSDVGIGVDNEPTIYERPDFSAASVFLNCFYKMDLDAAAVLADLLGRPREGDACRKRSAEISSLLRKFCWDPRDKFFYTADVQCRDRRLERITFAKPGMETPWKSLLLRIQSFSGFLPMWSGVASQEEADHLCRHLQNPQSFDAPFGVRTLSREEPMYCLTKSGNPSNWLGPVWIIANYLVWKGLLKYGRTAAASALAKKTLGLLREDLAASGSLHEYYDPDTGEPLMNKGFFCWNSLALEMIEIPANACGHNLAPITLAK